jgi:VWFA-related protein
MKSFFRWLPVFFVVLICAWALAQQSGNTNSSSSAPANPPAQNPSSNQAQSSSNQSQGSGQREEPAVVLRVTSRLVLVDVVATDNHGKPVTDLKREDFTVLEDGREQKLTVFSLEQGATTQAAASQTPAQPQAPKKPGAEVNNYPTYKPNGAMYIVLLDGLNTTTKDQIYVREQLLKLLEKLPKDRPVCIYALGSRLHLLQDFTSDPAALKAALKNYKQASSQLLDSPGLGIQVNDYSPGVMEAMADLAPQLQGAVASFHSESVVSMTEMRVADTLAALRSIGAAMSGYHGRKNLIWVTAAFPANIFPDDPTSPRAFETMRNFTEDIERTAGILSDAQISVYPIDARTLINSSVYSDMQNSDSGGNYLGRTARANSRTGNAMGNEISRTEHELQDSHASMITMADQTGGRAFYNRNDVDGMIKQAMDDGSTYYTLGYVPSNDEWNNKYRKISVKTDRKDVKVRFRSGYYAMDPLGYSKLSEKQRAIEFGQALNLDYPISTALPFRAQAVPPTDKSAGKSMVYFGADPKAISFELLQDGTQHATVDCAVRSFNMKGEPIKVDANRVEPALNPEKYQYMLKTFVPCSVSTELPPGTYFLRLAVRDERTGLIGSANSTLVVPPGSGASAAGANGATGQKKQP